MAQSFRTLEQDLNHDLAWVNLKTQLRFTHAGEEDILHLRTLLPARVARELDALVFRASVGADVLVEVVGRPDLQTIVEVEHVEDRSSVDETDWCMTLEPPHPAVMFSLDEPIEVVCHWAGEPPCAEASVSALRKKGDLGRGVEWFNLPA